MELTEQQIETLKFLGIKVKRPYYSEKYEFHKYVDYEKVLCRPNLDKGTINGSGSSGFSLEDAELYIRQLTICRLVSMYLFPNLIEEQTVQASVASKDDSSTGDDNQKI